MLTMFCKCILKSSLYWSARKKCKDSFPTCPFDKHILFRVNTIIYKMRFTSLKKVCYKNFWLNYKKLSCKWKFSSKEKQVLSNQFGTKRESCLFQCASHNLAWTKQPAQCYLFQVSYNCITIVASSNKQVQLKFNFCLI